MKSSFNKGAGCVLYLIILGLYISLLSYIFNYNVDNDEDVPIVLLVLFFGGAFLLARTFGYIGKADHNNPSNNFSDTPEEDYDPESDDDEDYYDPLSEKLGLIII